MPEVMSKGKMYRNNLEESHRNIYKVTVPFVLLCMFQKRAEVKHYQNLWQ
jgi:hypothetical protein